MYVMPHKRFLDLSFLIILTIYAIKTSPFEGVTNSKN